MTQKHKKILTICIAASLVSHIAAVAFIQRHSLWFSSPQKIQTAGVNAPWLSLLDKTERDQILKESFESTNEFSDGRSFAKPKSEPLPQTVLHTQIPSPEETLNLEMLSYNSPLPFPESELLSFNPLLNRSFSFPEEPLNLFEHLPKDLLIPAPSHPTPATLLLPPPPLPSIPSFALAQSPAPTPIEAPSPNIVYSEPLLNSSPLTESSQIAKAPVPSSPTTLPKLPTLAELGTSSYSDAFDAELVFSPDEDKGYIFALTLIPRPDLKLTKIRQNYTFLIDRANSIQNDRLHATKNAVYKVLDELYPDDTFNIIVFDSKMEKLSPSPVPYNLKSLAAAEEFLNKISLGSFFSQSNLFRPLFLTVPGNVKDDEIHTAILLTDGESLAKKNDQRALLAEWTQYNQGKVALFAISMGSDAHIGTMDAACTFNKGKLSTSPAKRGIKRKLLKLIKTIHTPVAKNLRCSAISRTPQVKVQVFPKSSQMPHLYLDQPYVILGHVDSLDDFILFVQGRVKDGWFNIKKTISFLNAKKGNQSLKAEWALQKAYGLYEHYLWNENPELLAEAKLLLEPYEYQPAFQ